MADRDYYEILGVQRGATADEIKKAYRQQARKLHPDVNPGNKAAEAQFKELQEAYDVLSETEKRAMYDQFGKAGFQGVGPFGPRSGASEWAGQYASPGDHATFDFSDLFGGGMAGEATVEGGGGVFEDILGRLRGGRAGRGGRARAPQATEADLTIPFETAVRGGTTTIEIPREGGRREVLDVKIPPGTETGQRLRLRGQGSEAGPGGDRGDLNIRVTVQPHPYFRRDGQDLSVEVPITVGEAVLGGRIEVPTLGGRMSLNVPAGTSSGQRLRLRGQGVPARGSAPAGDLFVVPRIVVPRAVDDEARRAIETFAARDPSRPREGLWPG